MKGLVSVPEAASALELSIARVRLLASNGDLPAEKVGGRWLIERSAVERHRHRQGFGGRRFNPENAWTILALASGEGVAGVDPRSRSRLSRALAAEGLEVLAPRLERRGKVVRFRAHPGEIAYMHQDSRIVRSGVSAAREVGLDLVAGREVDGYIGSAALDWVIEHRALAPTIQLDANVVLRIVADDIWDAFLDGRRYAPEAAVALDLAEDPDPRSQAAAKDLLRHMKRGLA